jgi:hypothetical protein
MDLDRAAKEDLGVVDAEVRRAGASSAAPRGADPLDPRRHPPDPRWRQSSPGAGDRTGELPREEMEQAIASTPHRVGVELKGTLTILRA